jgi:hypothetical protein
MNLLSGLTPLKPEPPTPKGGKSRKIKYYRPPTVPVPIKAQEDSAVVVNDLSLTQIMGGEKGNLVISDIVAAIRDRTQIDVYLLDTFNFSKVKAKKAQYQSSTSLRPKPDTKVLEMTQAIQDL